MYENHVIFKISHAFLKYHFVFIHKSINSMLFHHPIMADATKFCMETIIKHCNILFCTVTSVVIKIGCFFLDFLLLPQPLY